MHPEIKIVYEDSDLLVLDKPAGVPCLPGANLSWSVLDWIKVERPHLMSLPRARPDGETEAGMLHRIDNETSGLLAFAKTGDELSRLRHLWTSGKVSKLYSARVFSGASAPPMSQLKDMRINIPIGHSLKSARRMIALEPDRPMLLRQIRGKPQVAESRILQAHEAPQDQRDLLVEIRTGVRHQIRVHLACIGHPIVGDSLYGGPPESRLFLHAAQLEIPQERGLLRLVSNTPWLEKSED